MHPAQIHDEINREFRFHPANDPQVALAHDQVRDAVRNVAHRWADLLPDCDLASYARTRLREAMWAANAAIACYGVRAEVSKLQLLRPFTEEEVSALREALQTMGVEVEVTVDSDVLTTTRKQRLIMPATPDEVLVDRLGTDGPASPGNAGPPADASLVEDQQTASGFTSHGHPFGPDPRPADGFYPLTRALCGGPGLCRECAAEVEDASFPVLMVDLRVPSTQGETEATLAAPVDTDEVARRTCVAYMQANEANDPQGAYDLLGQRGRHAWKEAVRAAQVTWSQRQMLEADEAARLVYEALGAASMCWVGGTGVAEFDSTRAARIGRQLLESLGYPTPAEDLAVEAADVGRPPPGQFLWPELIGQAERVTFPTRPTEPTSEQG